VRVCLASIADRYDYPSNVGLTVARMRMETPISFPAWLYDNAGSTIEVAVVESSQAEQ